MKFYLIRLRSREGANDNQGFVLDESLDLTDLIMYLDTTHRERTSAFRDISIIELMSRYYNTNFTMLTKVDNKIVEGDTMKGAVFIMTEGSNGTNKPIRI